MMPTTIVAMKGGMTGTMMITVAFMATTIETVVGVGTVTDGLTTGIVTVVTGIAQITTCICRSKRIAMVSALEDVVVDGPITIPGAMVSTGIDGATRTISTMVT